MADRRTRVNTKTAATWTSSNPVLAVGEVGHESDTGKIKVGDGSSSWSALSYTSATTDTSSATNFTSTLQVNGSDVTTDADIGSTIQAYDANLTGFVAACNLPTSDGTADQVLKTDGAGTISFATQSGAGGSLSDQGVTASASELNTLDGITATTAELNTLDGITATTAELNYCDGVTSNIQTQLDGKQPVDSNLSSFLTALDLPTSDGTNGQVLATDGAGNITWTSAAGGGASSEPNNVANYVQLSDGSGGFKYVDDGTTTYIKYSTTDKALQVSGLDSKTLRNTEPGSVGLSNTTRSPSILITYWLGSTKWTDTLLGFGGSVSGGAPANKYAQAYGIWWWPSGDSTGAQGIDLGTYPDATLSLAKVNRKHTVVSVVGAGTKLFDAKYGYNFIVNQPAGDFTCNFRNMKDESDNQQPFPSGGGYYTNGRWIAGGVNNGDRIGAITVEIMIIQGSTAYMPTAVQIDGTPHTITWEGNSAPSGTANGKDIVYFDMYKIGTFASHTIHVLGRSKSFGGV